MADPEVAVYAAAKAATLSITRSFALAYAERSIRVNAVCPKIIDTPMQREFLAQRAPLKGLTPSELDAARLAAVPMKRAGTPAECAEVILFLLSSRASYMTGEALNVTGGWMLC